MKVNKTNALTLLLLSTNDQHSGARRDHALCQSGRKQSISTVIFRVFFSNCPSPFFKNLIGCISPQDKDVNMQVKG